MTESVKCLLHKHEDLSLVPRIHVKSWAWQHAPVILVTGSQNLCKELGGVACTRNPGDGEPETGGPQRLAGEQTLQQRANKFFIQIYYKRREEKGRESERKGRFERGKEGESWLFQDE